MNKLILGAIFLMAPYLFLVSYEQFLGGHLALFYKGLAGGSALRYSKVFWFGLFSVITVLLNRYRTIHHYSPLAVFFIILAIFNTKYYFNPYFLTQFFMICFGAIFFINLTASTSKSEYEFIGAVLALNCFIFIIDVIFDKLFGLSYRMFIGELFGYVIKRNSNEVHGILNNSNLTGAYIALTSYFLIKYKMIIPLILCFVSLVILNSTMAMATFFAIISFYYLSRAISPKVLFIACFFLFFIFYFNGLGGADNGRFYTWGIILKQVKFFGNGLGSFELFTHIPFAKSIIKNEHSVYLTALNSFGVVGLISLLGLFWNSINYSRDCALLFGLFVNFYANLTMHCIPLAMIAIYIFTLNLQRSKNDKTLERQAAY